jgi:hypothetical protein
MNERVRVKPKNKRASVPSPAAPVVPFGPPPVIVGEDPEVYNGVLERVFDDLKPRNYFEENCATAYAYQQWKIDGLRHGKASYLNRHAGDGLKLVLEPLLDYEPVPDEEKEKDGIAGWERQLEEIDPFKENAEIEYRTIEVYLRRLRSAVNAKQEAARDAKLLPLVEAWVKREPDAVKEVDAILAAAGMTMADVMMATQNEHWTETNVIDHHIAEANKEAAAILREFHWRRRHLSPLLEAPKKVIDGECEDITSTDEKAA